VRRCEHLVDQLVSATIDAPGPNYVDLQEMVLGRDLQTSIFQHPSSTIVFPPIEIGKDARLLFACGIKEVAWQQVRSPVRFTISYEREGRRTRVFASTLDPRQRESDRQWQRHELDLSSLEGQSIRLVLQTSVGWRRSTAYAWAGWADPTIAHDIVKETPTRHDNFPHIFLLTADALSSRYLSCYGHPTLQTPHLDQLAADGVLMEQAWSQSCVTFGSYTSILTGKHPHQHGVSREWQPFPVAQTNLPALLRERGYHTMFASGSGELSGPNLLDRVFTDVLPAIGNPRLDGAVLTRQFIRHFQTRPNQPCFSWIHYFDVHPPAMAPPPFNSLYYSGDPTDSRNAFLPSEIDRIRGVESLLIMRAIMPLLERGEPVAEVVHVLEDTAAILAGDNGCLPDFAEHVLRLKARAMGARSREELGAWLRTEARALANGQVSRELLAWMKEMSKLLNDIEADIICWLRDVVDLRFPLAMYLSTVAYLDSHVGSLVAYLQEQGLYDQSLIIFTSPHGEVLADSRLPYHHLLLTPETVHVPLIIKPSSQSGVAPGRRMGGVFDLIDLLPTVMDMQGFPGSFDVAGVSRWDCLKRGEDIPLHDSFASGLHQLSHSICRPPYFFAREKPGQPMTTFHSVVSGASEVLYDTRSSDPVNGELPSIVGSLRQALSGWLPG
jgi:hypothetical protein